MGHCSLLKWNSLNIGNNVGSQRNSIEKGQSYNKWYWTNGISTLEKYKFRIYPVLYTEIKSNTNIVTNNENSRKNT